MLCGELFDGGSGEECWLVIMLNLKSSTLVLFEEGVGSAVVADAAAVVMIKLSSSLFFTIFSAFLNKSSSFRRFS
jgi:hypothetical protein